MKPIMCYRVRLVRLFALMLLAVLPTVIQAQAAPHLVVNVHRLNVRNGPGVGYNIVTSVAGGTQLSVMGKDSGGLWYQISSDAGTGWVNTNYTVGRGNFTGVPTVGAQRDAQPASTIVIPVGSPRLVVNVSYLNIRSGPGVSFNVILTVSGGTELPVSGRDSGRVWYQVNSTAGTGWVHSYYTVARGNFSGVATVGAEVADDTAPIPVITDAGTPRLAVNTYRLNVRSGPGVGHPVLTSVGGGTELPVISIHADRLWYEVASPAGTGWVNSYYAVTRGDFSRLSSTNAPVQTSPVLTGTTPRAVVNTSRLNIRSGPGVAHGVITSVQGGTTLAVLGISSNRIWYRVQGSFGQGWLNNGFVVFRGAFNQVPVIG